MDTKLNPSEEYKHNAALCAKRIIDKWNPDVVVTSGDNAAKYLIVPFFMNTTTPFVFYGLNWDASEYGFPVSNITGMVEVAPLIETLALLKTVARGTRIGYIGADVFTNRNILPHHTRVLGIHYTDGRLVSTFDEWAREYTRLQDAVDILIWLNPIGIKDWDRHRAHDLHCNTETRHATHNQQAHWQTHYLFHFSACDLGINVLAGRRFGKEKSTVGGFLSPRIPMVRRH